MTERQDAPLWGASGAASPAPDQQTPPFPVYPRHAQPVPRRRLTPLYLVVAAVCVLGGVLAVAIIRFSGESGGADAPPADAVAGSPDTSAVVPGLPGTDVPLTGTTTPGPEWTSPVTTTTTDDQPAEYRTVTGPEGVHVAIPADWPVKPGVVPSNMQADSPAADRLIRFGGSAATEMPLLDTVATNETENPNIANGYRRIQLAPVPSLAVEAVDWEFLFVKDGVTRHSYGRYWRLEGIDYVVYASTSAELWDSMTEIIDVMVRTAGPVS